MNVNMTNIEISKSDNLDYTNEQLEEDEEILTDDEEYDESEDDSLTNNETLDLEPVSETKLEQNQYEHCNSNCNTLFIIVKKHFKPTKFVLLIMFIFCME
jgi:hypothetical protein